MNFDHTKRKVITQFLVCIVVGLIMNVGLAWLAVATVDVSDSWDEIESNYTTHNDIRWFCEIAQGPAYIAIASSAEEARTYHEDKFSKDKYWWSRVSSIPDLGDTYSVYMFVEEAWGFPQVCLISKWKITYDKQFVQSGIPFGARTLFLSYGPFPKLFPVQPIWRGLIVNTSLYAFIAWFALFGRVLLRNSNRRKHDQCIYCRYEVRDLTVCPECGNEVGAK